MKPQDVARTWAEYLSAMMRHLTTAQTGTPEAAKAAEKRIADLIQEVLLFSLHKWLFYELLCGPITQMSHIVYAPHEMIFSGIRHASISADVLLNQYVLMMYSLITYICEKLKF